MEIRKGGPPKLGTGRFELRGGQMRVRRGVTIVDPALVRSADDLGSYASARNSGPHVIRSFASTSPWPLMFVRKVTAITLIRLGGRGRGVIVGPPGATIASWLRVLFTKKQFDHVFGQHVTDYTAEYLEALNNGHKRLATWRRVQLNWTLIWTAALFLFTNIARKVVSIWKVGT